MNKAILWGSIRINYILKTKIKSINLKYGAEKNNFQKRGA